jgi:hypothetical protein
MWRRLELGICTKKKILCNEKMNSLPCNSLRNHPLIPIFSKPTEFQGTMLVLYAGYIMEITTSNQVKTAWI